MKLLLYDLDSRYYRYKIEASSNNTTWTMIVDRTATTNQCRGWQNISFSPTIQVRYLRLIGTYNSANAGFHAVEWEVYGTVGVSSFPVLSSTGNGIVPDRLTYGRAILSRIRTGGRRWTGILKRSGKARDARGGWLVLAYGQEVKAQDVQVQWAEGSSTNLLLLGSADADQWYDLAPRLKEGPVSFEYLWVVLPEGEVGTTPKVSEIKVNLVE